MKLEKAIEILSEALKHPYGSRRLASPGALKLGIEAIKHFKHYRDLNLISFVKQLPGETLEDDSP